MIINGEAGFANILVGQEVGDFTSRANYLIVCAETTGAVSAKTLARLTIVICIQVVAVRASSALPN